MPTPIPSPQDLPTGRFLPSAAHYDQSMGEFLLPYSSVRTAEDPEAMLLTFFQSAYEAAAELAGWDRARA